MVAYAFTLALTGPAVNTLHNTRILSDSLACAQVFSYLLNISDINVTSF